MALAFRQPSIDISAMCLFCLLAQSDRQAKMLIILEVNICGKFDCLIP